MPASRGRCTLSEFVVYSQLVLCRLYTNRYTEARGMTRSTSSRRSEAASTRSPRGQDVRRRVARKNYRIDVDKLKRARRVLGTANETETIHRALDLVVDEAALVEAVREFVRQGHGHLDNADASRS